MSEVLAFNSRGLDRWTEPELFTVTRTQITEYAAATNDPIAAHQRGDVAAPMFAVVPVLTSMLKPAMDAVPDEFITRMLHSKHDIRFHRPIRPGDQLASRAKLIGYQGIFKGRRVQKGSVVAIKLECRTTDGELVNEQHVTGLVLGFNAGPAVGHLCPDDRFDEGLRTRSPEANVAQHIDGDQTFRYAAASGDRMPIHLDDQAATEAGLPGIILHGLCLMAFTSWAILREVGESDVNRLRRLTVKFSKMALPGDDLQTRIWSNGKINGAKSFAFETVRGMDLVITDGLAELAD